MGLPDGFHHSEATKKKISESNKGIRSSNGMLGMKHTSESRKKMSLAKKGKPSSRLGAHLSELTKLKIRIANLGKHLSEETKRKIGEASKGRHPSEETLKKLRGHPVSKETRLKISQANTGRKRSDIAIKKTSDARRGKPSTRIGYHHSEETRKKLRVSHLGKHLSEQAKRKLSEFWKGKKHSKESIEKYKKSRIHQVLPFKDTRIEVKLQDELSSRGYAYQKHYPITGQPDIVFVDNKLAIFCDGDYVHGNPEKYKPDDIICFTKYNAKERWKKDTEINEKLQSHGWLVLRYWEHEINANVEGVVDEITDCLFRR